MINGKQIWNLVEITMSLMAVLGHLMNHARINLTVHKPVREEGKLLFIKNAEKSAG